MNTPSSLDLDVLEALDAGGDPASQPPDAIERLAGFKLVSLRPPGRVMLTGTAKELLLRRQYGLPLPLSQEAEPDTEAEQEPQEPGQEQEEEQDS